MFGRGHIDSSGHPRVSGALRVLWLMFCAAALLWAVAFAQSAGGLSRSGDLLRWLPFGNETKIFMVGAIAGVVASILFRHVLKALGEGCRALMIASGRFVRYTAMIVLLGGVLYFY